MVNKNSNRMKRGHPVALLLGLDDERANFWRIYSEKLKQDVVIKRGRKRKNQDIKQLYHFHEDIINELRIIIKDGIRSVLLVAPPKTNYVKELLDHLNKHHSWIMKKGANEVSFSELEGNTRTIGDVTELVSKEYFNESVSETVNREVMMIMDDLDKIINNPSKFTKILYTIKEIEKEVIKKWKPNEKKPDMVILTNQYLENPQNKNRLYRIVQIAQNNNIKTKIVDVESEAGKKVADFGGLICFTK